MKILLTIKNKIPLPRQKGNSFRHGLGAGGGERAPVALCREPVYVATPVGAERSPLATSARRGSGDQGVGRLAPQANKIPPLRGAPGFSAALIDQVGKTIPENPGE